MAIRVTFHLVDDLDGTRSPDVDRIVFGLDGTTYEIDLSAANAARMRERLMEYVDAARCAGRTPPTSVALRPWRQDPVAAGHEPVPIQRSGDRPHPDWQLDERKSA